MSITTAATLLERADRLTRQLSADAHEVSQIQWEQFDNTVYRTLHELIGAGRADAAYTYRSSNPLLQALRAYPAPLRLPPERTYSIDFAAQLMDLSRRQVRDRIRQRNLHAVKEGDQYVLTTHSLHADDRDIAPADPTEPHPIARLSVTLGAFADLVSENNRTPHPLDMDDHARTDTVRRVLALTAVTAQHTVRHTPMDAVDRPLLIARYASTHIDTLDPSPRRALALDHIAAITPDGAPMTINEQLDVALHAWSAAAHREVSRMVPSTEALSSIANQGVRLYAVTHHLIRSAPSVDVGPSDSGQVLRELRDGGASLRTAEMALVGLTSLTRPTHDFVAANRDLFTTLERVREMAASNDPGLDARAALAALARGIAVEAELLTTARGVPAGLLHCRLLFAPARTLEPSVERLEARRKGRFIPVELADAPDLGWRWEAAARKAPEVAVALGHLDLRLEEINRDHGIELGR